MFYNLVTSKSDNATFNKEYAKKQEIVIIEDIDFQNKIADELIKIDKFKEEFDKLKELMDKLI